MRGRSKITDKMLKMSSKVDALEGYSVNMESTNRDVFKKTENLAQLIMELRDYVFAGDMHSSHGQGAPGTVRSNLSGMFSSRSKNPLEIEENLGATINELKIKYDELKQKTFNYQNAINRLQGEKQQMYQSMNQFKLDRSSQFATPVGKNQNSSIGKVNTTANTVVKDKDKSEAMIEYLRAEISHLRDKNKAKEQEFINFKNQSQTAKVSNKNLKELMNEILRPGKDLIYQLCSDPHLSESFFYKEDHKFEGIESKFCLDIVKIFDLSSERIVDLRSVLDQKEQVIRELDRKLIEHQIKINQQDQIKQKQEQSANREIESNFEGLDKKCREFASNLKVLAGELEKEKTKSARLDSENEYLKDHIKHKLDSQKNQEILIANIESREKIAREQGIRQGRREGIMDSKVNEYIEQYKREIEQQGEKIVYLEEAKEKLELECNRLRKEVEGVSRQINAERNLQKSLSREIEELTMEVKSLKHAQEDD